MTTLSNATLHTIEMSAVLPGYDRRAVRPGIAHFGVGNFHRTHEAVYIDRCLHLPDNEGWGIVGIGLSETRSARQKADSFQAQDGLYTVTEFDFDGTPQSRVIGAMIRYLHAPSDPEAVLSQLSDPNLRIVSLTITEGGYLIDEASGRFRIDHPDIGYDLANPYPRTVFGYLVRALERRRDSGAHPFTVVSCDNLRSNGDTARKAVLAVADAIDPDLASWIAGTVGFPNSMVDRIAPYVTDADRQRLNKLTGIDDRVPAMSESYLQWVIEDKFPSGRPALEAAGVEVRNDVALFETVKGRLLNASHVLLSYPSLLIGHRLVSDALADKRVRMLIDEFMTKDSIPLLHGPAGVSLEDYKEEIIRRFSNPAIADQIIRIATDGSAKIPVFHAATTAKLLEGGADARREAFLLACYRQYLDGVDDIGKPIAVTEPSLSPADREEILAPDGLGLFRIPAFAALQLESHPVFVEAYLELRKSLKSIGAGATIDSFRDTR